MARALSTICLVWLICTGGAAWAGKPKIAILGLEVVPGPTGAVDASVTQVAKELSTELRLRAQSDASPYVAAPNGNKELTDEKLLMSCDNEANSCMAVIGSALAADVLLYGHIEKRGEIYRVTLKLLDVKAKTVEASGDDLPVGSTAASMSKKLYSKVTGVPVSTVGTLVIKARSRTGAAIDGQVVVDELPRGPLADGTLTLAGVAEGRRVVAIDAGGYQRFEAAVTIQGGQAAVVDAVLVEKPGPRPHSPLWKWSLGAGIALAISGGAFAYYSNDRMVNHNKVTYSPQLDDSMNPVAGVQAPDASDCGKSDKAILDAKHAIVTNPDVFDRACTWKTRIYIGYVAGAAGALGAVLSLIMLSRDTGSGEGSVAGIRGKKTMAITPIVMPGGGGASLSLRW